MLNLSIFAERLLELMSEQEINAPTLADTLKTDRSNITRYLQEEQTPYFQLFVNIVDYFNISADYLLGLNDFSQEKCFLAAKPFDARLRYVLDVFKISQYQLVKDTGISSSVLYRWLNGKSLPTLESLVKLAKYLDCSVDFLLGREN